MSKDLYSGKFCLECKHFIFNTATYGYSEMTPGTDARMECLNGHWELKLFEDSTESYREKVHMAETCPDFEPVEEQPVVKAYSIKHPKGVSQKAG